MGRAQAAATAAESRACGRSGREHHHPDCASLRAGAGAAECALNALAPLRGARAQCLVANGLQGPLRAGCGALPSACANERAATVEQELRGLFARYGLPERVLTDNGPPWGHSARGEQYTTLTVWLMRLGIRVLHGRPHHPQTQGKDERFHRSLRAEVLAGRSFADLGQVQRHFDRWRTVYNTERPHEALQLACPVSHYQISARALPPTLPPIEYGPDDIVRRVQWNGEIYYAGREFHVGKAFHRLPVALRPRARDGQFDVVFCHQRIGRIRLDAPD